MSETKTAQPQEARNISDTARWAAYFHAEETKRPDAIFRDPFAERLCGQHGADIANTLPDGNKHAWAWVTRTYLFDHFSCSKASTWCSILRPDSTRALIA